MSDLDAILDQPEILAAVVRDAYYLSARVDEVEEAISDAGRNLAGGAPRQTAFELALQHREVRLLGALLRLDPSNRSKLLRLQGVRDQSDEQNVLRMAEHLERYPQLVGALAEVLPTWFDQQPWLQAAGALLWRHADADDAGEQRWGERARDAVRVCRAGWDDARERIGEDPWADERYPIRVLEQLDAFLGAARGTPFVLAPGEVALLVTAPFLHEAVRAQCLAWLHDPQEERPRQIRQEIERAFERVARAAGAQEEGLRRALGLWLDYRAVDRLPEMWDFGSRLPFLDELREAVRRTAPDTYPRLADLARCVSGGLECLFGDRGLFTVSKTDQQQRWGRLGALLLVAGAAALDVRRADHVVVDHLLPGRGFELGQLRAGLARGRWEQRGTERVFGFGCEGAVQHFALVELVRRANGVLEDLRHRDECRPLSDLLPTCLSSAGVVPLEAGGGRAFKPVHVRFRLDHVRVRELLMGNRLYADPTVAVRELYQNALDACRYRRARARYLERQPPHVVIGYEPKVVFRQGEAEGRPYIECDDNGVGMSELILEQVFAMAGARFHDQPEFIEERSRWRVVDSELAPSRPKIDFVPNSQHGIGVLSYFLLADELEVETRPYRSNGERGDPLRVRISSAAGLFIVEDSTRARCGTRVRLYLRERSHVDGDGKRHDLDLARILRRFLVVSELPVEVVVAGEQRCAWTPGVVRPPEGADWTAQPTASPDLWWTEGECPVLADGIVTETRLPFLLVNLTGGRYPELSADRSELRAWDGRWIGPELGKPESVTSLLESPWTSHQSLVELFAAWPGLERWVWPLMRGHAPRIPATRDEAAHYSRYGAKRQLRWEASLQRVGLTLFDHDLVAQPPLRPELSALEAWRLRCMSHDLPEPARAILRSNPRTSNEEPCGPLLGRFLTRLRGGLHRYTARWRSRYGTRRPATGPPELAAIGPQALAAVRRWSEEELGLHRELSEDQLVYLGLGGNALAVLRRGARRLGSDWSRSFGLRDVLATAVELEFLMPEVARHLEELAPAVGLELDFDPKTLPGIEFAEGEVRLLSRDLDGEPPWLEGAVPACHLLWAASQLELPVAQVAERLAELAPAAGLQLDFDPKTLAGIELAEGDVRLLSRDLDGQPPWLEGAVPARHLLWAASQLELPPAELAHRLVELAPAVGLQLDFDPETLAGIELAEVDVRLISWRLDGQLPLLEGAVPVRHLLCAASRLELPLAEVAKRLVELAPAVGLELDFDPQAMQTVELREGDRELLTTAIATGPSPTSSVVTGTQVLAAASALELPVTEVTQWLEACAPALGLELGFDLEAIAGIELSETDRRLVSRDLDAARPWLEGTVPGSHLLHAAAKLELPASKVAQRLAELAPVLGLRLGFDPAALADNRVTADDRKLLSEDLDGRARWLEQTVPAGHALRAAEELQRPLAKVVERLHTLAPALGLRLAPCWDHARSEAFEATVSALLELSDPAPYDRFDATACALRWLFQAADHVERGLEPERGMLLAGREWVWWLTDDQIERLGQALLPGITRDGEDV